MLAGRCDRCDREVWTSEWFAADSMRVYRVVCACGSSGPKAHSAECAAAAWREMTDNRIMIVRDP